MCKSNCSLNLVTQSAQSPHKKRTGGFSTFITRNEFHQSVIRSVYSEMASWSA